MISACQIAIDLEDAESTTRIVRRAGDGQSAETFLQRRVGLRFRILNPFDEVGEAPSVAAAARVVFYALEIHRFHFAAVAREDLQFPIFHAAFEPGFRTRPTT